MRRLALFAAFVLLAGCNVNDPVFCTLEFVAHEVRVLMPDGTLAQGVDVDVFDAATGRPIDVCQGNLCDRAGIVETYIIYHDGLLDETSALGRRVVVRGTKGDLSFEADYRFRNDGCHVRKMSGPETVTLAPPPR